MFLCVYRAPTKPVFPGTFRQWCLVWQTWGGSVLANRESWTCPELLAMLLDNLGVQIRFWYLQAEDWSGNLDFWSKGLKFTKFCFRYLILCVGVGIFVLTSLNLLFSNHLRFFFINVYISLICDDLENWIKYHSKKYLPLFHCCLWCGLNSYRCHCIWTCCLQKQLISEMANGLIHSSNGLWSSGTLAMFSRCLNVTYWNWDVSVAAHIGRDDMNAWCGLRQQATLLMHFRYNYNQT